MDLSIFGTNQKLEEEGVWHDIGEASILVARHNNKNNQRRMRDLIKPIQTLINAGGDKADELVEDVSVRCLAETVLIDWKDLKDDGVVIEYSKEKSLEMLKKYPDFKELVATLATRAEHYRTGRIGETVKN